MGIESKTQRLCPLDPKPLRRRRESRATRRNHLAGILSPTPESTHTHPMTKFSHFAVALLVALCAFAVSVRGTEVTAEMMAEAQAEARALVEMAASATSDSEFGTCKTCVFVVERIKKGTNLLLPAICSEIYLKFPNAYSICHEVLNALSLNGNNVRYWLFEGCYKYEIYNAKEWVKPCPSHVMCTVLKQLNNEPFCKPLPMENPFENDSAGGGS